METVSVETATASAPARRWPLFLVGILLFFLGPVIYAVQVQAKQLETPWYALVLATIGVLLMTASVWQRGGVLRTAGLVLFVLVCGLEWYMVLVTAKTPLYTGPAQPGHKIPAFATALSDGRPFTNDDLESGIPTVLLFFRGRW